MSLLDRLEVPEAKSRASTSPTERPRVAASRAAPLPTTPPPTTSTSSSVELMASSAASRACGESATDLTVSVLSRRQLTSTQSNVLVTAFFQRSYPDVRCSSLHCGCQRFDSFQLVRSSSVFFQNPTASPAAYAAPSAVVSATTGRLTGTPSTSAWICMHSSLAVTPPSTLSTSSWTPESCSIASATSRL